MSEKFLQRLGAAILIGGFLTLFGPPLLFAFKLLWALNKAMMGIAP